MAAQQQPAQALASHLVAQTLSSVALLENLGLVTAADAQVIRSKLPNPYATFPQLAAAATTTTSPASPAAASLASPLANLNLNNNNTPPIAAVSPPPAAAPVAAPPPFNPDDTKARGRAIWDYAGTEHDDLAFRAGDEIIIDEEVNANWYRGRVVPSGEKGPRDKVGLFPSNYIEKIAPATTAQRNLPPPAPGPGAMTGYQPPAPGYQPPGPGQQQPYYQPPANVQYGQPPPQQPQTVVVQQAEEPKKGSGIGGKLGNAAVQGAGFGFGASIASNLVNAIL
ncbi:Protein kinase C and casein kinase substrate in neurons 2 protein [Vanrija pseudolonga]|uniref:Protein kinase C and casein kinase substrate in neurons 2 protein n=1 Tax=Vanrija pseudolonga TaxID=143232 RepID=A0AAF0Y9D4_9TREE|nr:Protein kinase C and casein kinase substrate in neurons 2 protein [Vanrija pseudolonga]